MLISCGFVFLIRHFNSRSNLVLLKKLILEPVCERTQYSNIHTNNIQETCYWLAYNLIWIIWDWNQVVVYDQRYFMKFLNYNWNLTYGWCILYHAATKSSSSLELAWLEKCVHQKWLISVHKITKQNRNPSEHAATGINKVKTRNF
jgi:hypothetical protein